MRRELNYCVVIKRQKNIFIGEIRELAIIEKAEDLNQLWRSIEDSKQAVLERFIAAGIEDEIPTPISSNSIVDKSNKVFLFVKKLLLDEDYKPFRYVFLMSAVFFALCGFSLMKASVIMKAEIDNNVIKMRNLPARLENLSEEKKEHYHKRLRSFNDQLLPFAQDIKPLFDCIFHYESACSPAPPLKSDSKQSKK